MHWDVIPAVASTISLALAPIAAFAWRVAHKRALKRNAGGCCGACGLAWTEIGVAAHEYQVHGVHVCAPCAHRLRRRTIAEFAGLAAATALDRKSVV